MDNLVFEESLNVEVDQSEFTNKRWVYVNDNNNGNYTSQIVIDSTPLSNAGGWINWQEGFIMMPLVIQLSSATSTSLPVGTTKADYAWAIKNGFWQMINSMSVEFNNQNIIQQTPFLNVFRSFKSHTSFSQDDVFNQGASIGYYPDSAGSWAYEALDADGTRGIANPLQSRGFNTGITNNANAQDFEVRPIATGNLTPVTTSNFMPSNGIAGTPSLGSNDTLVYGGASNPDSRLFNVNSCNEGMRQRQTWNGYDVNTGALNQQSVNAQTACDTVLRSTKDSTVAGVVTWKVYAKLRLKDLAEFFEKCPLLKGSTMRFYINTNQAIVNFTAVPATVTATSGQLLNSARLNINSVNVVGGLTCPLMVASTGQGQGGAPLTNNSAQSIVGEQYNLSVSIFKNNFSAQSTVATQTAIGACRLYAPVYTFNPIAESKYLSLAPTRRILYRDVFQYQFNNIGAGSSFNFLVSNGINRIKSVLVVPFVSKSNVTVTSATSGLITGNQTLRLPFDSWQNPCNTAPATPDPIMITNFNVLISGVNLFMNNENYDFEAFRQQLISSNQLNGSLTTGLASGLISEDMFSRGYRYYYGDCSRTLPSEENVSRSVQIVGQNASLLITDIMVFVEFMKEITVDVSTGARIE